MKGSIARAEEIVAATAGRWMPQQFENPANIEVHRRTTAQEILRDFADAPLDALITGVGTGGHITGCAEVLKKAWPKLKVFAVEPTLSPVISGGEPGPHPIQGIGAGFIPAILDTERARRRDPGRSPTTPRRWRAAPRARKACWSASRRARRSPAIAQKLPELGERPRMLGVQLRHRRALPVGARLPARRSLRPR